MNYSISDIKPEVNRKGSESTSDFSERITDSSKPIESSGGVSEPLFVFLKPKIIELDKEIQFIRKLIFGSDIQVDDRIHIHYLI